MRTDKIIATFLSLAVCTAVLLPGHLAAQDLLPETDDAVMGDYHNSPRYRESESHPLRVLAYVVHPVGWALRELIFRPLSYFAGSTPETKSIMGYREPFDFRSPSCFKHDDGTPDCRKISPFDYNRPVSDDDSASADKVVYFPDVNFDFNKRTLNKRGKERAREVAALIKRQGPVDVVLEGNADSRGTEAYNQKLGLERAEAVKAELSRLGVSGERMSTVSFGESRPLFTEKEEWAYAANRRVAVRIDGSGTGSIIQ
mgnify:CR=1 FL=1